MPESDSPISPSPKSAEAAPDHRTGPPPPPPPPPPLPPFLVNPRRTGPTDFSQHRLRPSPYLDKLASTPEGYLSPNSEPRPYASQPIYYFFYGTLAKPTILKEVLGLEAEPVLRPAKVYSYELTNWGQYKALIDGPQGTEVAGAAYLVESADHEYKLAYYETNAYTLAPCKIHFTDGREAKQDEECTYGRAFVYAGDAMALKAGRFDRALWEMQMGRRLPPAWGREDAKTEGGEKSTHDQ